MKEDDEDQPLSPGTRGLKARVGHWGEDSNFPVADWQDEVANGGTRQGYWQWLEVERAAAEEEEEQP